MNTQTKGGMPLKLLLRTYLPAAISGLLLFASFPTIDLFPLAWIALVPLMLSLWDKGPRAAFFSGLLTGTLYFFGTLYWIYHSITYYGSVPFIISVVLVLLLSLYLGLYVGLFALVFSLKIRHTRLPALILAPVFWVTLEFIRSYALTGFPWASIGYSQYRFLYGIQYADITGVYGVSFLVLAVNSAIADFFILKRRRAEMPLYSVSYTFISYAVFFLLLLTLFPYSYWRIHQQRPGNPVRVSIIQGNIEQDKKWQPGYQDEVMRIYKELTTKATASTPSLVIWPETSVPFYFGYDTARSRDLVEFQRRINSYLLFGSVMVKSPPAKRQPVQLTNSAVLLDPEGNISYVYDKIHLVPFGEYVPLRSIFFFLDKLVAGIGDYEPGNRVIKANTGIGSFGTFICYEIIFPGLVRKCFSKDGDFMVTITNDAWFGRTSGPFQHFSMAVFRAIENRKPVLRAANTGISGYIDSNGKVLMSTSLFERREETVEMTTDSSRSFYSKYGDIFSYICIVVSLLLLI
ncbi:MAG TPA: apolipoprotein N-acyltransferase [Thermodesulfovibrionales bacterium]|nr:apolipoprotein N-acyltransferase [Thermodesulfovibrionales bacterium]